MTMARKIAAFVGSSLLVAASVATLAGVDDVSPVALLSASAYALAYLMEEAA